MNPVGAANGFPSPVVAAADIFHPAVSISHRSPAPGSFGLLGEDGADDQVAVHSIHLMPQNREAVKTGMSLSVPATSDPFR